MGALRLNPLWVARGLILVVRGELWITPQGTRRMTAAAAPRLIDTPQGRATGYGTTDAGNTTGRFDGFRLAAPPAGLRSYFGVCRMRTLGGGGLGRIFQDATGSGVSARAGQQALWAGNSNGFSTPALQISDANNLQNTFYVNATTGFFTLDGSLRSYGFSCEIPGGSTPALSQVRGYVDGIEYLASGGTMSGTVSAGPWAANGTGFTDMVFGNRPSDSLRNFDGQLGIFAAFDASLTAAEHASLHANPQQLLTTAGPRGWLFPVSSGAVYDVTVLDTATATDTIVGRLAGWYVPATDVSTNGWTPVGAPTVAQALANESNSDYGVSPDLTSPYEGTWDAPMPAGSFNFELTLDRTGSGGQVRVVLLDAGGATVGVTAWQAAPVGPTLYTFSGVTLSATSTKFRIEVQP